MKKDERNSARLFYTVLIATTIAMAVEFVLSESAPGPPRRAQGSSLEEQEPARPSPPPAYKRRHALLVGLNDYRGSPAPGLSGANGDASETAALLHERFGFENVVLLLDAAPDYPLPARENGRSLTAIVKPGGCDKKAIVEAIRALAVGPEDALLFYYAGHGAPEGLVPGNGDPEAPKNLLRYSELIEEVINKKARHTLVLLDCCCCGAVFGREAEALVRAKQGASDPASTHAFQVIAAASGKDPVDDVWKRSRRYRRLKVSGRTSHERSPFAAVLLEGLRGRAGRFDGQIRASQLGNFLVDTLTDTLRGIRQLPRWGRLGDGDGDFTFVPRDSVVLDPALISALYLRSLSDPALDERYAPIRSEAALAMYRFVTAQELGSQAGARERLVGAAVSHLGHLIRDRNPKVRRQGLTVFADLAARFGGTVRAFEAWFPDVCDALEEASGEDPAAAPTVRDEAARVLGALGHLAPLDRRAAPLLRRYVDQLAARWRSASASGETEELPERVLEEQAVARAAVAGAERAGGAAALSSLEKARERYQWLLTEGLALAREQAKRQGSGRR